MEQLAGQYPDLDIVAVAGRSSLDRSAAEADRLGLDGVLWGYDDELWATYQVFGQPTGFLITGDDRLLDGPRYRISDETSLRDGFDALLAAGT